MNESRPPSGQEVGPAASTDAIPPAGLVDIDDAAAWAPPSPWALLALVAAAGLVGAAVGAVVANMEYNDRLRTEREGAYRRGFQAGQEAERLSPGGVSRAPVEGLVDPWASLGTRASSAGW